MSNYGKKKIIKNSLFLKVVEGAPHTLRLLDGDPTEQFQHNINQKLVPCTETLDGTCVHCEEGHSRQQRFVTNVYSHNDGRVMLWSYGPSVAEELKAIALSLEKDETDILEVDLEVSATGSGLQKKTKVQPRMKSQILPTGLKLIEIKRQDGVPY